MNSQKQTEAPPSRKARVKKEGWVHAALAAMLGGGVEAVRVERLAKTLGITKSGFYYHFRDREDLLAQLLDYWAKAYTDVVISDRTLIALPPRERLLATARMIDEMDLAGYDPAMLAWSRVDARTAKVVAEVIDARVAYVRNAFRELGFRGEDLEIRARAFVAIHSSDRNLFAHLSAEERLSYHERRLDLLLSRDVAS